MRPSHAGGADDPGDGLAAEGLGIVYATHDPNHALRAGTRALVYLPGGRTGFGPVAEMVAPELLSTVYGVNVEAARTSDGRIVLSLAQDATERRSRRGRDVGAENPGS